MVEGNPNVPAFRGRALLPLEFSMNRKEMTSSEVREDGVGQYDDEMQFLAAGHDSELNLAKESVVKPGSFICEYEVLENLLSLSMLDNSFESWKETNS